MPRATARTPPSCTSPPDGSLGHGELDLVPRARLVVTVRGPIEGSFELAPESFDAATGTWLRDRVRRLRRPNGVGGTFVFALEGPGRWRVADAHSGATSTEAELQPGQREARVELETAPEGQSPGRVHQSAVSLEGPRQQREISSRGEATLRLGGLGPGPYRVRASRMMDVHPLEQSIVLDEHGEHRIQFDLR